MCGRGELLRTGTWFEAARVLPADVFLLVLPPGAVATKPRASKAYTATFDLLQASMVAVSSDWFSVVSGNPPENSTTIFRPGMARRFLAKLRTASNMLRAPKSASALPSDKPNEDSPVDATVTGASGAGALGSTDEVFTPATAARSTFAFAVKFCTMRS